MVDREHAGEILLEMVKAFRVFRASTHRQSQRSISGSKIGALHYLKMQDARLGDLARHLAVSASVASRAVDALETDGLVRRGVDDADARAIAISITDAGRAHLAERHRYVAERFAEVLEGWTAEEVDEAITLLQRLNIHFEQLTDLLEADDRREPSA